MGAILCFHSLTSSELPAAGAAHVSVGHFRALVRTARLLATIVPLSELLRRHQSGENTAGLAAVTFDDAYAALGAGLRDVMLREGVPVAIFVATGASASATAFWWDRIDDAAAAVTPDRWRAFEAACGLPEAYRRGQPREHGPLRPLRQWILATHAGRWPDHLETPLARLEDDAGTRTLHRAMSFDELEALHDTGLVEIGVHTVSHPVLPLLDDSELERELAQSRATVRDRFRKAVPVLAIPFGLYDERTLQAARAAGLAASLTLESRTVHAATRSDVLPRFCVTASDTPFRLGLRMLDVPHVIRGWAGARASPYPDLPSATT